MQQFIRAELRRLISLSSESGCEKEILRYLEEKIKGYPLPTSHLAVGADHYNLLVNPLPCPELLVGIHVDTVPCTIEGETCLLREEGEYIYGRGAADAKGSVAAMLTALELMGQAGRSLQDYPVTIAFTIDEENEATGSEVLATQVPARAALVMEPTRLALAIAQAGSLVARLTFSGRPAHGSEFEAGDSAIKAALAFLAELEHHPLLNTYHPLIGRGGLNIRQISGGSDTLAVPARCTTLVDFRIQPDQDINLVEDNLADLFTARKINYEFIEISPAYNLRRDASIIITFQEAYRRALGGEATLTGMKSWTDAENLVEAGIPTVIFGPGNLQTCHTPWENIRVAEVWAAAQVLERLFSSFPAPP